MPEALRVDVTDSCGPADHGHQILYAPVGAQHTLTSSCAAVEGLEASRLAGSLVCRLR